MKNLEIVYTLSDVGSMVSDCINSIISLRKVYKKGVSVILTPPAPRWEIREELKKYLGCTVLSRGNRTEPFKIRPHTRTGRFGEKISALSIIEAENVLFLDNDTRVLKNPETLFDHDFDFSARVDNGFSFVNWEEWTSIFGRAQKLVMPLFNAGVMAFKNNNCHEIMTDALRYMSQDLPHYGEYYQKDQLAIGLSLGERKYLIRYMTQKDHAFRWLDESHDTVIYHGSKRPFIKRVGLSFKKLYNHFS